MSDEVIDLIIEHGNRMESRLSRIVIQFFGGAAARVGPADTAFAQRQAEYNVGIETQWTEACDNVLSCEVVTAEGEIVTANAGTNADLFWGLRGGGGILV